MVSTRGIVTDCTRGRVRVNDGRGHSHTWAVDDPTAYTQASQWLEDHPLSSDHADSSKSASKSWTSLPAHSSVLFFLRYSEIARVSCACTALAKDGTAIVQYLLYPFSQHCFGWGRRQEITSSCAAISLYFLSEFLSDETRLLDGILDHDFMEALMASGSHAHCEFCVKVLRAIGLEETYTRPDELLHHAQALSDIFQPIRTLAQTVDCVRLTASENENFDDVLDSIHHHAVSIGSESAGYFMLLGGKASSICVHGIRYIAFDSHEALLWGRGLGGHKSLTMIGCKEVPFKHTVGEVMCWRIGGVARYNSEMRGCAWWMRRKKEVSEHTQEPPSQPAMSGKAMASCGDGDSIAGFLETHESVAVAADCAATAGLPDVAQAAVPQHVLGPPTDRRADGDVGGSPAGRVEPDESDLEPAAASACVSVRYEVPAPACVTPPRRPKADRRADGDVGGSPAGRVEPDESDLEPAPGTPPSSTRATVSSLPGRGRQAAASACVSVRYEVPAPACVTPPRRPKAEPRSTTKALEDAPTATGTLRYRDFQKAHKGISGWTGIGRCPWPRGRRSCEVCDAFFCEVSVEASEEKDSPEEKALPAPLSDIETMRDCNEYIERTDQRNIFKLVETGHGYVAGVRCLLCECVLECGSWEKGARRVRQHERYIRHQRRLLAIGRVLSIQHEQPKACEGVELRPRVGEHGVLGRLHGSLCRFVWYMPTNTTRVQFRLTRGLTERLNEFEADCDDSGSIVVQARECALGRNLCSRGRGWCTACNKAIHCAELARSVARLNAKLDAFQYFKLLVDDGEAAQTHFAEVVIPERDYVKHGLCTEIYHWLAMDPPALLQRLRELWECIPKITLAQRAKDFIANELGMYLRISDPTSALEKATRALTQALATDLALGRLSKMDVRLSASLAAGDLKHHPVQGLLDATLSSVVSGTGWHNKCHGMDPCMRGRLLSAAIWLAGEVGVQPAQLRALNLIASDGARAKLATPACDGAPFAAIDDLGRFVSLLQGLAEVIAGTELAKPEAEALPWQPLYMLWDETYVRRGVDLMPKGLGYRGEEGVVGGQWHVDGSQSNAMMTVQDAHTAFHGLEGDRPIPQEVAKTFQRSQLACQVLDIGLRRADAVGPTLTCCFVPKGCSGDAIFVAVLIGRALRGAVDSQLFVCGCGYDNAISHQLIDGCLLGEANSVSVAAGRAIPFFSELSYRDLGIEGFPFSVPVVRRLHPGASLEPEPFYGSRDPPHTKKVGVFQVRTSARVIVFGEFFVDHTSLLLHGLPAHAYSGRERQSDLEAALVYAVEFFGGLHWDTIGIFIWAFLDRVHAHVWWDDRLSLTAKLANALFCWHCFECARMLATKRGHMSTTWVHPGSYRCLSRCVAHVVVRCASWPKTWHRWQGKEEMEWKMEHLFAVKRGTIPSGNLGIRDFAIATNIHERRQRVKLTKSPLPAPVRSSDDPPSEATIKRVNSLARTAAVALLVRCCPGTYAEVSAQAVSGLEAQYLAWSAGEGRVGEELPGQEEDDCDYEGDDANQQEDQKVLSAEEALQTLRHKEEQMASLEELTDVGMSETIVCDGMLQRIEQSEEATFSKLLETGRGRPEERPGCSSPGHQAQDFAGDVLECGVLASIGFDLIDPRQTLFDLVPKMREYMAIVQAAEGFTPKGHIDREKARWHDILRHELAVVRRALNHEAASRTSRMQGWEAASAKAVQWLHETEANTDPICSHGVFVPTAYRPRATIASTPAESQHGLGVQVLLAKRAASRTRQRGKSRDFEIVPVIVLAVYRSSAKYVDSDKSTRSERCSRLSSEPLLARFANSLKVVACSWNGGSELKACPYQAIAPHRLPHVWVARCRTDIVAELEVIDTSEDLSWPPELRITLSASAEAALRRASTAPADIPGILQFGMSCEDPADGERENNKPSPTTRGDVGRCDAGKRKREHCVAQSQLCSKGSFDSAGFLSRGWTQKGREAIYEAMRFLRVSFDHYVKTGGQLVDESTGNVRSDMGGQNWESLVNRAPSFMETRYGKSVEGVARALVYSRGVHARLVKCQERLSQGELSSFKMLLQDISQNGDKVLMPPMAPEGSA